MNELLDYIFKNLSNNNLIVKNMCKVVSDHRKALRWMNLCMCGICIQMSIKTIGDSKRDKQIEQLKKEIEELKQKGE